jgi:hypothetical protein
MEKQADTTNNTTKSDLEFIVFQKFKEGKNVSQISKELNLPITNIDYYKTKFIKANLLKRIGKGVYEVIGILRTSSLGTTKPTTNLHALQISFPILNGTIPDSDWEIKEKLNNWIPKYTELKDLGGVTIKNNNNKSLTVWAKSRNVNTVDEVQDLAFKLRIYIYNYFRTKHSVELDLIGAIIKNLDIATEDKNAEGMRGKGEKFVLNHGIKAEKVFENDNRDSKSMIDGSPFKFSAETNDLAWKREYLRMPFSIRELKEGLMYVAENYKSHVGVVEDLHNLLSNKKARKIIKNKVNDNNQSNLGEFI